MSMYDNILMSNVRVLNILNIATTTQNWYGSFTYTH